MGRRGALAALVGLGDQVLGQAVHAPALQQRGQLVLGGGRRPVGGVEVPEVDPA